MKDVVVEKRKKDFIQEWVKNKIKNTYVRMKDRYKDGDYEYEGWVRE